MTTGFRCPQKFFYYLLNFYFLLFLTNISYVNAAGKPCTRNSINLGNIINTLLKDYDTHLLPDADGVNVTIEMHVQVRFIILPDKTHQFSIMCIKRVMIIKKNIPREN